MSSDGTLMPGVLAACGGVLSLQCLVALCLISMDGQGSFIASTLLHLLYPCCFFFLVLLDSWVSSWEFVVTFAPSLLIWESQPA